MAQRSTSTGVAPPRVSFSRYNQVAPPRVQFSTEDAGSFSLTGGRHPGAQEQLPAGAGSTGGRDRASLQPINSSGGPITSVSKANLNSYPGGSSGKSHYSRGGGYYSYQHKDHGTSSWYGAHCSTSPAGSINTKQGSPTQHLQRGGTGGAGNAVYDFSQRVILTNHRRSAIPAEYADAPNTDYIYEAILGSNTSINNRINTSTNSYNLARAHTDTTMQGCKSAGGGGRPISKPSPTHRTSASPHSEGTGAGEGSVTGSGTGGPRYRDRRPVSTKVVQVGPKSLPPGAGAGGMTRRHGRGVDGFFPPVKLRDNSFFSAQDPKRKRAEMQTPPFVLELAPEEAAMWAGDNNIPTGALRAPSAKSSIARSSDPAAMSSSTSCHGRQYTLSMTPPVYPHVTSDTTCDDLTSMPRPRMMVSRGELPWVFRHKVKRSMNELSKIMASKPPQSVDAIGTFSYHYDR